MFSFFHSDEKVVIHPAKFIKHAIDIAENEYENYILDIEKQCKEKQLNVEETKEVLNRVKSRLTEIAIQHALNEIRKLRLKQYEENLADNLSKKRKAREGEDQQARDKIEETVDSYLKNNHDKLNQVAKNAGLTEQETKNVFQRTADDSKHNLLNIYQNLVSKIDKKLTKQDLKEAVSDHLMKCVEELFEEHLNIYRKYANEELKPGEVTNLLQEAHNTAKITIKDKLRQEFSIIDNEITHKQLRHSI